jgi:hypothetical protein
MICGRRRETGWKRLPEGACFIWRDGDAYDVEIVDYH